MAVVVVDASFNPISADITALQLEARLQLARLGSNKALRKRHRLGTIKKQQMQSSAAGPHGLALRVANKC
jgi:hypothetical protein